MRFGTFVSEATMRPSPDSRAAVQDGLHFARPMAELWAAPDLVDYFEATPRPMDLRTVRRGTIAYTGFYRWRWHQCDIDGPAEIDRLAEICCSRPFMPMRVAYFCQYHIDRLA